MKNNFSRTLGLLGVSVFAALLFGCSDGAMPDLPEPKLSTACSVIMQAYKAGGDPSSAVTGEIEITSGEGVVLVWDASAITSGTLTSDPSSVVGDPISLNVPKPAEGDAAKAAEGEETPATDENAGDKEGVVTGSMEFRALTHDVSFTIAARNEEKNRKPIDCFGHMSVKVKAVPEAISVNRFEANPEEIKAGGTSKLCWDVAPDTVAVTIEDDAKNPVTPPPATTPAPAEMTATGTAKAVSDGEVAQAPEAAAPAQPVVSAFPVSGCADIAPTKTTAYTLKASTTDGQSITKTVTVVVSETGVEVVSFKANGMETLMLDKPGDVELMWEVTPENAVVTIDNEIGEVGAKGSKVVTINETKTFTLTASLGDKVEAKQVTVSLNRIFAEALVVTLKTSAVDVFAGEEVEFNWAVSGGDIAQAVVSAKVNGPSGNVDASGNSAFVKPEVSGAYYVEVVVNGASFKSNSVNISVRNWDASKIGIVARGVESVGNGQTVLVGTTGNVAKVNGVYGLPMGRIIGNKTYEDFVLDIGNMFSVYAAGFQLDRLLLHNPFVVGAFAVDPTKDGGKRVYVGGTGFIGYSSDNGLSWNALDVFPIMKEKNKTEIPTCRGEVHKSDPRKDDYMKNIKQVCDMVVDTSTGVDKLIAAMDDGIRVLTDVDKRVASKNKDNFWKPVEELKGVIAESLVIYGGKVFAGTAKGVWVSDNGGDSWAAFNGGDMGESTAIYKVAVDGGNKKIYAGGPDGLYVGSLAGGEWKKASLDAGAVYSVAIDPAQSGTVYVGTAAGVYVTRNCCPVTGEGKWINITETMGSTPVVYDIAVSENGSNVGIYAATSDGAFMSMGKVVQGSVKEPEVPIAPEPTPEPAKESAASVLKSLF